MYKVPMLKVETASYRVSLSRKRIYSYADSSGILQLRVRNPRLSGTVFV